MPKASASNVLRRIVAENVRIERTRHRWSQEELAEKSQLHRNYVGAIERGTINFGIDSIAKIAKAFGLPPHQLLQELRRGDN